MFHHCAITFQMFQTMAERPIKRPLVDVKTLIKHHLITKGLEESGRPTLLPIQTRVQEIDFPLHAGNRRTSLKLLHAVASLLDADTPRARRPGLIDGRATRHASLPAIGT